MGLMIIAAIALLAVWWVSLLVPLVTVSCWFLFYLILGCFGKDVDASLASIDLKTSHIGNVRYNFTVTYKVKRVCAAKEVQVTKRMQSSRRKCSGFKVGEIIPVRVWRVVPSMADLRINISGGLCSYGFGSALFIWFFTLIIYVLPSVIEFFIEGEPEAYQIETYQLYLMYGSIGLTSVIALVTWWFLTTVEKTKLVSDDKEAALLEKGKISMMTTMLSDGASYAEGIEQVYDERNATLQKLQLSDGGSYAEPIELVDDEGKATLQKNGEISMMKQQLSDGGSCSEPIEQFYNEGKATLQKNGEISIMKQQLSDGGSYAELIELVYDDERGYS